MSESIKEKVIIGVITAVVLGGLTLLFNFASSGGLVRALGGVTEEQLNKKLAAIVLKEGAAGAEGPIPDGVVIASLKRCTDLGTEWQSYDAGAGRVIVGVGETTIEGTARKFLFEEAGGYWEHQLTVEEMPRHNHEFEGSNVTRGGHGSTGSVLSIGDRGDYGLWKPAGTITHTGGQPDGKTEPHNNMPPYIALYFCKKEG